MNLSDEFEVWRLNEFVVIKKREKFGEEVKEIMGILDMPHVRKIIRHVSSKDCFSSNNNGEMKMREQKNQAVRKFTPQ